MLGTYLTLHKTEVCGFLYASYETGNLTLKSCEEGGRHMKVLTLTHALTCAHSHRHTRANTHICVCMHTHTHTPSQSYIYTLVLTIIHAHSVPGT